MFLTLLVVTFLVAAFVALATAWAFRRPIQRILNRLVSEDLGDAWRRYVMFAIFVVGVSGGVRIYELQRFIEPRPRVPEALPPPTLDANHWVLEVYRTVIQTLQSIAWMLLVFFLVALVAYVILRGFELKAARSRGAEDDDAPRGRTAGGSA